MDLVVLVGSVAVRGWPEPVRLHQRPPRPDQSWAIAYLSQFWRRLQSSCGRRLSLLQWSPDWMQLRTWPVPSRCCVWQVVCQCSRFVMLCFAVLKSIIPKELMCLIQVACFLTEWPTLRPL